MSFAINNYSPYTTVILFQQIPFENNQTKTRDKTGMVQIAYRNRELTSYPKINHVFVSSKAVLRQEHFPASTKMR